MWQFFVKKKETCYYPLKQQFQMQQTTHYHMTSRTNARIQ